MYAHVCRWEFKPGRTDEALRRLEQQFLPSLRRQADFHSCEVIKTAPDHAMSISRWHSEVGALAARALTPTWVARVASAEVGAVHTTADSLCPVVFAAHR